MKVLLIEDNVSLASIIQIMLEDEGINVDYSDDGLKGLKLFKENLDYDAVVIDIKLPGLNGYEIFKNIKKINDTIPIIIITAFGNIPDAVKAIKSGAFDYITKPFDNDEFLIVIKKAIEYKRLKGENVNLKNYVKSFIKPEIIGQSNKIEEVKNLIKKIAPTDATVLILGESGVGKELFAREIHCLSKRADNPFVSINCSAIPENLFESELFGYRKGAFTGADKDKKGKIAEASKGTVFLDEIAELPYHIQAKLLRFLQEGEIEPIGNTRPVKVDVRVVAATNKNLQEMVKDRTFREDLFYRLNVFPIKVPSLRERREDVPLLVNHIIAKFGFKNIKMNNNAIEKLKSYDWPGNIRELENIVYRLCLLSKDKKINEHDLPVDLNSNPSNKINLSLPNDHL
ncbi:MAG: sigma-54 dependent transcriptional regulator, partial [Deferribacterota bacterium]|nr:sigma-54 dependent transcriptional regulator [Deferribacterota bacterium]